jgi:hypothetical protein
MLSTSQIGPPSGQADATDSYVCRQTASRISGSHRITTAVLLQAGADGPYTRHYVSTTRPWSGECVWSDHKSAFDQRPS